MSRFERYRTYLRNGLFLHKILLLLGKFGFVIEPYIFYCEYNSEPVHLRSGRDVDGLEFFEAGMEDAEGLALLDPNMDLRKEIRREFEAGRRCFALKREGTIIAASWCNTREIDFEPCRRPLAPNEVYLSMTMTLYRWRGRDMALYLRSRLREALLADGRDVAYSFTDYYNRPARRFKSKLGARLMFTGLFIKVFNFRGVNWTLVSRDGTSAEILRGVVRSGG
jgi:hypothetical protein